MPGKSIAAFVLEDAEATGSQDQVDQLLEQYLLVDANVKTFEDALEAAKAQRLKLQMEEIPAAMDAARKRKISYADGGILSLKAFLAADLPSMSKIIDADEEEKMELEQRRMQGFGWLRANNGGAIIKNELRIELPKGKDNVVAAITAMADELGLTWSRGEEVHHMTLKSFLKEKLKAGVSIPVDVFRLVTGQKAHYKAPKETEEKGE